MDLDHHILANLLWVKHCNHSCCALSFFQWLDTQKKWMLLILLMYSIYSLKKCQKQIHFPAEGRTFLRTLGAQRTSVRSFVTQKGAVFEMTLV